MSTSTTDRATQARALDIWDSIVERDTEGLSDAWMTVIVVVVIVHFAWAQADAHTRATMCSWSWFPCEAMR